MKPNVAYRMPATREAMRRTLGPQFGRLFVPSSAVSDYAVVVRFPDAKNVTSGELQRAMRKLKIAPGNVLVVGRDFTREARDLAVREQNRVRLD